MLTDRDSLCSVCRGLPWMPSCLQEVAKMTAEVSAESKLPIKVDEYLEKFKPNV